MMIIANGLRMMIIDVPFIFSALVEAIDRSTRTSLTRLRQRLDASSRVDEEAVFPQGT